ncbi:hypothetical protein M8J76_012629 [Diaphorina citri]|nr:hypothetical protein M8J75_014919 [Diaphorina citri]KAI5727010.1 hypothetical protein M8J76_012629 [Diaphorina citri]KAI5732120.1 hypothetical protein M8J77_021877 [Diaphorina citri]
MSYYYQHEDTWTWDLQDINSHTTWVDEKTRRTVILHPNWSKGAAGIRGTRTLNHGRYYWELNTTRRTTGTSVQFGIGTKQARTHHEEFVDLMGNDENSWALSHRGLIFHGGVVYKYTDALIESSKTIKIGVEFDGIAGTLGFYKDGEYLGIAFHGLQHVKEPLYPMVSSTALRTKITLELARQDYIHLKDMCRASIIQHMTQADLDAILLPVSIKEYIDEAMKRVKCTPFSRCRYYALNFD